MQKPNFELFLLNPKSRHSGMERRNLGSMDGGGFQGIPAIWIPAIPAGMTYLSLRLKNLANRMPEH